MTHTMKYTRHCFFLLMLICQTLFATNGEPFARGFRDVKEIVSSTFQIKLDAYPQAFNPSIIEIDAGYVLTFRYLPEPVAQPWICFIGIVLLDRSFRQISPAQLLDARFDNLDVPSQTEDARIFAYQGNLYVTYNDSREVTNTTANDRRDIYVAKLTYKDNHFILSDPVKLIHPDMYSVRNWEKNWTPFVWGDTLFFIYSISPNAILQANFESGVCPLSYSTNPSISWKWGLLRGGTPAMLIDGEYLAFFHSAKEMYSEACERDQELWHYFMGAYTFSANPPFNLTRISPLPINEKSFYLKSNNPKRVIYPGGFVIVGSNIYVAYGKDDNEIWIAVINKDKLMRSLRPVE